MTKNDEQPIMRKSNDQINRLTEYIIKENSSLAQDMFDFLAASQDFSEEEVDTFLKKVQAVRGHEKVSTGGQLRSPLVATKSPHWWPTKVPALH